MRITLVRPKLFSTQTAPNPVVISSGPRPTGTVAVTVFEAGSIRVTVPSVVLLTHTPPAPPAIPDGSRPTVILATTACEAGSTRRTVPGTSQVSAGPGRMNTTHTPPSPAARPEISASEGTGSWIGSLEGRFVRGSISRSCERPGYRRTTQTA